MRRRVLILGGGMGALTAAFELTSPKNPAREQLEVTVLQLGWRLGGKGASGRNQTPEGFGRIEEHGIHNLFGFYDNAFRVIRECYAELGRAPGAPMARWEQAFSPESTAVFVEEIDGVQVPWQLWNPTNARRPGEAGSLSLREMIVMGLAFFDLNFVAAPESPPGLDPPTRLRRRYWPLAGALLAGAKLWQEAGGQRRRLARALRAWTRGLGRLPAPLGAVLEAGVNAALEALRSAASGVEQEALVAGISAARTAAFAALRPRLHEHRARRMWILLNFSSAIAIGLIREDVRRRGLDALNEADFREWLTPYTLEDGGLTLDSVLMRVMYDSSFAYVDGDTRIPAGERYAPKASYEAGTLLRGLLRAALSYKGAFGWKMMAGTGDVIFAPLYEVLRRRGVKFEFFQRVRSLELSADRREVAGIVVGRQATIRPEIVARSGGYEPLVEVAGLPCWPSSPLLDQLVEGPALAAAGVDLESPWAAWPDVETRRLRVGEDFDEVLFAIGVGAAPELCGEVIAAYPRWRAMTQGLRTTATQALQLWLAPGIEATGWQARGRPITGFWYDEASPLNVWVDLSHLAAVEGWSPQGRPRHVSYFVSPLRDPIPLVDAGAGPVYPAEGPDAAGIKEEVFAAATRLLGEHMGRCVWPAGFDWQWLVDPAERVGAERLRGQYWRANLAPSERYVLSVPGSTKLRLAAHEPEHGPRNLFVAGDWTKNGLNCGAMESATMSGLLAAQAICGFPPEKAIFGLGPGLWG